MEININILRALYEQYFCNVCVISDQELLTIHFKCNEALDKNEDLFWDEAPLNDLVVWNPFADVMPVHVFDNILEGYKRFWNIQNEAYEQLCLELSVELAEAKLAEHYDGKIPEIVAENGDILYTEEAQDLFVEHVQHIDNLIRGCTQKP